MEASAGLLHVVQTPAAIAELEQVLKALEQVMLPRLVLEVAWLDRRQLDAALLASMNGCLRLDRRRAEPLWELVRRGGAAVVRSATVATVPGRWEFVGERAQLGVVEQLETDYSRNFLGTANRETHELLQGLAVLALPIADGRGFALSAVVVWQERGPPAPMPVRFLGRSHVLDRFDACESFHRISVVLDEDEALLLTSPIAARPELCLLAAIRRLDSPPSTDPGFTFVPHAMLTSPWLALAPVLGEEGLLAEDDGPSRSEEELGDQWWRELMAEHPALGGQAVVVPTQEGTLIGAPARERAAVRELVAALLRPRQRTFVLAVQRETRPGDREGEWRALGDAIVVPMLAQRASSYEAGRTRHRTGDVNLEGSNLWTPWTHVRRSWSGLRLVASVDACDELPLLVIDLEEAEDVGSRRVPAVSPELCDLELGNAQSARLRAPLQVRLGEWRELGRSVPRTVGGEIHESRVLVQVQEVGR